MCTQSVNNKDLIDHVEGEEDTERRKCNKSRFTFWEDSVLKIIFKGKTIGKKAHSQRDLRRRNSYKNLKERTQGRIDNDVVVS